MISFGLVSISIYCGFSMFLQQKSCRETKPEGLPLHEFSLVNTLLSKYLPCIDVFSIQLFKWQ